jgi:hypothetical protein
MHTYIHTHIHLYIHLYIYNTCTHAHLQIARYIAQPIYVLNDSETGSLYKQNIEPVTASSRGRLGPDFHAAHFNAAELEASARVENTNLPSRLNFHAAHISAAELKQAPKLWEKVSKAKSRRSRAGTEAGNRN